MSIYRKKVLIVGAGTAGAIVSRNLSSHFDVTILEKSANTKIKLLYRVPLMIGRLLFQDTSYVRKSTLPFSSDRNVPFFNSNLIGGASVINGCVHVLGDESKWTRLLKRFELTFGDFMESYHRLFTKSPSTNKIKLLEAKKDWLDEAFFNTLRKKGLALGDVERTDEPVYGMVFNTTKRYLRSSVMDLDPFKKSKIIDARQVKRLVLNEKSEVIGVTDDLHIFFADYIFLCAGVIETNAILLRDAIRANDGSSVALRLDAGREIKDHVNFRVSVKTRRKVGSLNEIDGSLFEKGKIMVKYMLGFWTLMRGTGATATANLDLDCDGIVDTRINLLRFYETGRMGSSGSIFSNNSPGFSLSITQINPKSSGNLTISSTEVSVEPKYLADTFDVQHLKNAIKFVLEILKTEPLSDVIKSIEDLEYLRNSTENYIFENSYSGYHLIGGCAHLLGENFEVKKYKNLYICDASAISEYPSPNIHSAVVILADLCSKKFAKHH